MKINYVISALTLCLALCLSIPSFTQDTGNKTFNNSKIEFNISVANIFSKSNWYYPYLYIDDDILLYDYYYFEGYHPLPELGVGMKFHGEKGAFRLRTSFYFSSANYDDTTGSIDKIVLQSLGSTVNLGYEWHLQYNRLVGYYGFDISSGYLNRKTESTTYNAFSESRLNQLTFGINPLIGVNVFVTPHLSIGTEVQFTVEYMTGTVKQHYTNTYSETNDLTKMKGVRSHFGPLGYLSVNIYF